MTCGFIQQVLCYLISKTTVSREKFCILYISGNKIKWAIEAITCKIHLSENQIKKAKVMFLFPQCTGEHMTFSVAVPSLHTKKHIIPEELQRPHEKPSYETGY